MTSQETQRNLSLMSQRREGGKGEREKATGIAWLDGSGGLGWRFKGCNLEDWKFRGCNPEDWKFPRIREG